MHELQEKFKHEIASLVKSCKRVAHLGYVTSHGGNLSARVDDDIVLITATKVPKGSIEFDDVCIIDMKGHVKLAAEGRKPTGEWPLHIGVFNDRPDLTGIIHAHPPAVTGLAIAHSDLLSRPLLPEPIIEVGPVLHVAYEEPLSDRLAKAFKPVIKKTNAFLMLNHGILLCSPDGVWRAMELLEMIEATARSAALSQVLGRVNELTRGDVWNLENVMKSRGLPMPGAPGEVRSLGDLYF